MPWQKSLYERFVKGDFPPSCSLPTGLGKTSIIHIWLIALGAAPDQVPRRLVYVVNRRTVVDQATRNVQVQATFDNPKGILRPGMFVEVQATLGAGESLVGLPASAISYAPYGDSVFILKEMDGPNGRKYQGVRQQFVKLGAAQGDQIAILDGVAPGDEVVSSGAFKLRNGAAVVVNNAIQPSNSTEPHPEDS